MKLESPPQQPEGALLHAAQQASGRSIRTAAEQAGMSDARWRQIIKGSMQVQGNVVSVVAPAHTLARMAHVVGVTADQLREVGRADAADALENIDPVDLGQEPQTAKEPPRARGTALVNDEIDMIYASRSMTAQQKLEAIRMVLHLRAQVDAVAGVAEGTAAAFDPTVITESTEN